MSLDPERFAAQWCARHGFTDPDPDHADDRLDLDLDVERFVDAWLADRTPSIPAALPTL